MEKILDRDLELGEMKRQMELLKSKLGHQKIINDRLVRRTMSEKVGRLRKDLFVVGGVALLGIPYCCWIFSVVGFSLSYRIVTSLFLLIAIGYMLYQQQFIKPRDLLEKNLLEVSRKLLRLQQSNANWLKFSIPFLCCWFIWFVIESLHFVESDVRISFLTGGIIGGVCGLIGGIIHNRNTKRRINEILEQIKTEEDPEGE